jgi:hypothetical protein
MTEQQYYPVTFDVGEQQYARVDGDAVYGTVTSLPAENGQTWLPVVNVDAKQFDARTMYRENPHLKRDGERVLRIYPIRNKADSYYAGDK